MGKRGEGTPADHGGVRSVGASMAGLHYSVSVRRHIPGKQNEAADHLHETPSLLSPDRAEELMVMQQPDWTSASWRCCILLFNPQDINRDFSASAGR